MPIYVGGQSADVWANQHLFELGPDGSPLNVSGVPPDLFSATGQLWGSPLFKWDVRFLLIRGGPQYSRLKHSHELWSALHFSSLMSVLFRSARS